MFWSELTTKRSQDLVPAENMSQPEDQPLTINEGVDDDTDVPLAAVIGAIINGTVPTSFAMQDEGGLESIADAKHTDDESSDEYCVEEEMG
jgi:hypothetical protein